MDKLFKPYKPRKRSYGERAIVNDKALIWLSAQTEDMRELVREAFASYLTCPVCEINRPMATNEELEFVFSQFEMEIDELFRVDEHFSAWGANREDERAAPPHLESEE